MEDFSQFLMGGQPKTSPQANPASSTNQYNVGNLRPAGSSTGFQQPASYEEGIKNMDTQLNIYGTKHKINTLRGVISRYAPSSENDTENYINFVSQRTGLKPDQPIDLTNPVVRHVISGPMILMEKGGKNIFGQTEKAKESQPTDNFESFLTGAKPEKAEEKTTTQPTETKKGFFGEVVEPLKGMSVEQFKKESMLPKIATGMAGTGEQKKQLVEDIYQGSEKFVKGVQEFAKHPLESTKAVAKEIYEHPGKFVGESIKGLIYDPETLFLPGVSSTAKTVKEAIGGAVKQGASAAEQMAAQLTAKNAPKMAGVGAAETSTKTMLDQAAATASPELKPALEKLKNTNPANINTEALNRHIEADSLPVPVRLTEGQATQNPVLISRERNERGLKEQLAQHLNSQNKALQENANLMKDRVAPDVFTPNHVADAESAIKNVELKAKAREDTITQAYKNLEDLGAGKIQVDSKAFGNGALSKLAEKDDIDFLPSAIDRKIREYASGKPMNFNQYENLRTQIARETRKAQSAQDGNAVHALTLVRSELEKLPLIGETAEAKQVADVARNLAKQEFDLLDKNKPTYNSVYANVVNGAADTKDFIPKTVLRSDNKDFAKAMDLFKDDPITMQHLASGTLDWIIRDSTDASGNFLTGKFAKHINNLDLNGKLTPLFGEEAKTLKNIAKTGQYIEARPKGSFVNESNTMTAGLAQMGKQYAIKSATGIPILGKFVEPAVEIAQSRAAAKEVKKSLKPGAGIEQKTKKTKLSDIGKK